MEVARYHRVSTDHQNLRRQAQATEEYVEQHYPDSSVTVYNDADTGTDTDRSGYGEMMGDVDSGEIDVVVAKDMSRVARSVRDLMRTVDRIRDGGVTLEFIDDPITVEPEINDPTQDLILQVLGAVAEFEAKITRQRIREGIAARRENDDYHHGPAPIGFEKDDGVLVEGTQYQRVCEVLREVRVRQRAREDLAEEIGCSVSDVHGDDLDGMSKREAADVLDTTRATVRRAIEERGDLYGVGK